MLGAGSRPRALGGGDRKHELIADGALNRVVVGGGPPGVETACAMAELYKGVFVRTIPTSILSRRNSASSRPARDRGSSRRGHPLLHREALSKRGVEVDEGEVVRVGL